MKAYKIVTPNSNLEKGRIFVWSNVHHGFILCATPVKPTVIGGWGNSYISDNVTEGTLVEVDLIHERWQQPHLLKEIREELAKS